MNPTYNFTGQVALVTGASSGMGFATARAFAEAGAAVVLADVNETTPRRRRRPRAAGHQVLAVACDVANEDSVATMVERRRRHVRTARHGVQQCRHPVPPATPPTNRPKLFDRVNAVNLRGVWACMKHELRPDARPRAPARS